MTTREDVPASASAPFPLRSMASVSPHMTQSADRISAHRTRQDVSAPGRCRPMAGIAAAYFCRFRCDLPRVLRLVETDAVRLPQHSLSGAGRIASISRRRALYVLENWITNFRREMAIQDAVRKSVGKRYVGQMSSEGRPLLRFWVSLASAKDSSSPDIDSSSESNRSDGFGFSALSACATRLVRWLVTLDGVA